MQWIIKQSSLPEKRKQGMIPTNDRSVQARGTLFSDHVVGRKKSGKNREKISMRFDFKIVRSENIWSEVLRFSSVFGIDFLLVLITSCHLCGKEMFEEH